MSEHSVYENHNAGLPRRAPDRIWAGSPTEATCAMCGTATKEGDTEVEVEYDVNDGAGTKTYRLHARCFVVLERGGWSFQ